MQLRRLSLFIGLLTLITTQANAQTAVSTLQDLGNTNTQLLAQVSSRVKFAPGNDNTSLNGKITGKEYRDYVLNARAGQTMSVSLIPERGGNAYFNILPPGSKDVAIYNSSTKGNDATIKLPKNGDYTIRVYLMGDHRDSNHTVPFMVSVTIM